MAARTPARHEIERRGIDAWLQSAVEAPVRMLCAPLGCGKTIAVRRYVERRGKAAAFVHVPSGANAKTLRTLIAEADAAEVVLDELDRADGAACDALREDVIDGLVPSRLIVIGRSRRRLRMQGLLARGLAKACDQAVFPFDGVELAALAASTGVVHEQADVVQLLDDTEGWPLAAHWLLRDALETGRPLRDAFDPWRERNAHLLFEFLQHERYEDADAFDTFRRMLVDAGEDAQHELERLEQLGLPIVRARGVLRPYRLLARLAAPPDAAPDPLAGEAPAIMRLNVLGRFRCEIAGRPLAFARRRDQQVFVYVAVTAEGRTSRERVLDAFWPGIDRTAASQSLRVTLSRIRRAILSAAPGADPERYFRTAGDLAIDTRTVAVDVRRFVDHIEQGRLDDVGGNIEGAKYHYRSAHRLYGDRLLASEGPEPCLDTRVADFESFYEEALTRLMSLYAATGELDAARDYAREMLGRNSSVARDRALGFFSAAAAASA
jgi:hypothetical protein